MNRKSLYRLLSLFTLADIAFLSLKCDLIKENFSMLTVNTEGFVSVLVLCALLSLLMYMLTGNKLSVFIITAGLAPFSFTHEIFAYVSFFALTIVFLFFVFNTRYFVPYIFVLMLALYFYLDNLAAVNGLVEVIYLSGIVLISQFLI